MLFNSPISPEKADRILSLLNPPEGAFALDVGCGRGELLIRLLRDTGIRGLGIDIDGEAIAAAQESAKLRLPAGSSEFRKASIRDENLEPGAFDLAMCIGSTHAFASGEAAYPDAVEALAGLVRPGGQILVGEGYWKQPPDPRYLELIGDPVGIYRSHQENVALAEAAGLTPLYAAVSSEDEWDHFEWSHRLQIERQAAKHPGDPGWAEKLKRSRAWRDGYLRWGRTTMGFGIYLFLKAAK